MSCMPTNDIAALTKAWETKNLEEFKKLIDAGVDPQEKIPGELYSLLFKVAQGLKAENSYEWMFTALANDKSRVNAKEHGSTLLHVVVYNNNARALEALIDAGANVNARGVYKSTALHVAVTESSHDCLSVLMDHPEIDLDIKDMNGWTPLKYAVEKENREAITLLLQKNLTIDSETRDKIEKQFPDIELPVPQENSDKVIVYNSNYLFDLLEQIKKRKIDNAATDQLEEQFGEAVINTKEDINEINDGSSNIAEAAAIVNSQASLQVLIEKCGIIKKLRESAINKAAQYNFYTLIEFLLKKENEIAGDLNDFGHLAVITAARQQHLESLQTLLAALPQHAINKPDDFGNTALMYAVYLGSNDCVRELLEKGAYLAFFNKDGESPLNYISEETLRSFLDKQVVHFQKENKLQFKYHFLNPPNNEINTNTKILEEQEFLTRQMSKRPIYQRETAILETIASIPHLRHLNIHPVLSSFTYLKWLRVQAIFYLNLSVYSLFCILLNGYILFGYRNDQQNSSTSTSTSTSTTASTPTSTPNWIISLQTLIFILIILHVLRELFQVAIQPLKYLLNPENWLEVILLATSCYVVTQDCSQSFSQKNPLKLVCPQLSAICILISCFELVLLIGKHPRFAVNIEMFKTVSWNFLRFLLWYALLIVAFALSFFVLFRGCPTKNESECKNPFTNPGTSLFKTIIMLTGEFEASDISFASFVGTSHIIFVAFVFYIAIVLLNLLNGLAVADTQAIRDDMELHTSIARLKLIALIEKLFLAFNEILGFTSLRTSLRVVADRVFLLPLISNDGTVTSNLKNFKMKIKNKSYFMDRKILDRAIRPQASDTMRKLKEIQLILEKIQHQT